MSDDVGRNDPCPCGSGAKYKFCCLRKQAEARDEDAVETKPSGPEESRYDADEERSRIDDLVDANEYQEAARLIEGLIEDRTYQDELVDLLREHPELQEHYGGALEGGYNTPRGRDEWDGFWDAYPGASRDESLEMIETQIREGSYFDDEWIGSALLDSFEQIVDTPERAKRWRDLVELTRQKYPEQIGYLEEDLIIREIDAAARYDMELRGPLDRLFEAPAERIDMIGDLIPRLAYAGRPEDMTSRLREAAEGLEPDTSSDFLDRAAWCAPYAWGCERANANLDTIPDSDEIDEVLGPMAEHVRPRIRERIIGAFRGFFGDVQAPDPHDEASFDTIGLRFGRQLVKSGGRSSPWPAPKAFYASIMLQMLIDAQGKHPPNQRQTTTYGDGKKIDQIRGHLQDASPLLPDPGFAANRVRDAELVASSRLGHGSAMAAQIIIEWLHFLRDYDLGGSKMVIKSIARHLPPALPGLNQYGWFANRDLTEDMNDAFSSLDSV